MPISEDEYDHHPGQGQHAMSKAEQRRSNKPIMEKRRRARINHCLNELKSLILDAMKKDPARHSKLEKADILEMTVKHLQSVQRQQLAVAVATDPAVLHKFKTGFNECAGEVSRYIGRLDGVEPAVKQRLVSHLAHCVSGLQQLTPLAFTAAVQPPPPPPPPPQQPPAAAPVPAPVAPSSGDVNNNRGAAAAPAAGLQLIPSRLPTGEFALLLPGGGNLQGLPFFPAPSAPAGGATAAAATLIDRSHPSAFTAVDRPRRSPPPPHGAASVYSQHPPLSPASSVSSGDDCSLTSEPYLSSSSPPPPPAPAPTLDAVSPTAFKPPAATDSLAPAPPPPPPPPPKSTASVGVGTVTEVKLEFKTIPVHGSAVFPIITTSPSSVVPVACSAVPTSLSLATHSPVHQPLSVITSQSSVPTFKTTSGTTNTPVMPSVTFSSPVVKDPPLDFSIKKEEQPHLQCASTQTTSSIGVKRTLSTNFPVPDPTDGTSNLAFSTPNKMPRYSLHVKTETETPVVHSSPRLSEPPATTTTGSLLKVATLKNPYPTMGEDLTNKSQFSSTSTTDETSGASSSTADAAHAGSNKDMWRPW